MNTFNTIQFISTFTFNVSTLNCCIAKQFNFFIIKANKRISHNFMALLNNGRVY